ncbi:hypothetical protein CAPTEDRAFT_208638, partial [Capitella teleta]
MPLRVMYVPDDVCAKCNEKLTSSKGKKGRTLWRRLSVASLRTLGSPLAFHGNFLCYSCHHMCKKDVPSVTPKKTRAKKRIISTPVKPSPKLRRTSLTPSHTLKINKGVCKTAITRGRYSRAIKAMVFSKKARDDLIKLVTRKVKREVRAMKVNPAYKKRMNRETLEHFSWSGMVQDAEATMPFLMGILKAAMPSVQELCGVKGRSVKRQLTNAESSDRLNQRLCVIVASIMYSHLRSQNLIQTMCSAWLWLNGCSQK